MNTKLPGIAVLLAAVLWGTTGTAQRLAPSGASPLAFGAMRLAVAALFLLIVGMLRGQLKFKGLPAAGLLTASLGMALYQPLFFSGIRMTGIAVGTSVTLGSAPVITGCLEWAICGKKPKAAWWLATLCAVTGSVLLLSSEKGGVNVAGLLMAVGAGGSFAVYTLASKRLLESHSSDTVSAAVFGLSALWLSPLLFFFDLSWLGTWNGAAASLHIGIAATGIAYLLYTYGLARLPAASAVTLSLGEPLTASLLGVLLFGEQLGSAGIGGAALLLGGLAILAFPAAGRRSRMTAVPDK